MPYSGPITYNEKASQSIYNAVRCAGAMSRSEIADFCGLARSTVSLQVAELLARGLLTEEEKLPAQRKLKLSINPKRGYFIGGLLGTRRFSVQIVNLNYQVVAQKEIEPTEIHEPQSCNTQLRSFLRNLIEENSQVHGRLLGLGFPFPVDFSSGKPDSPPYIPCGTTFPWLVTTAKNWGCRC